MCAIIVVLSAYNIIMHLFRSPAGESGCYMTSPSLAMQATPTPAGSFTLMMMFHDECQCRSVLRPTASSTSPETRCMCVRCVWGVCEREGACGGVGLSASSTSPGTRCVCGCCVGGVCGGGGPQRVQPHQGQGMWVGGGVYVESKTTASSPRYKEGWLGGG